MHAHILYDYSAYDQVANTQVVDVYIVDSKIQLFTKSVTIDVHYDIESKGSESNNNRIIIVSKYTP